MIVLSVGMPRAGSGWHYNLIHDLMESADFAEAREIREQYHLQKILTEVNVNIGVLSLRRLGMVMIPALMGKDFVIKAHAGPTLGSRTLSALGLLQIVYIYRDPRDAMLSAYEYGQRSIAKGRPNFFSQYDTFEKTLDFMAAYVDIWAAWMQEKRVLTARYEDLLTNYDAEAERLVSYLGLDADAEAVRRVVEQYRPGQAEAGQQGLHFFKGKMGRFRQVYTNEQQVVMSARFGDALRQMGYEL